MGKLGTKYSLKKIMWDRDKERKERKKRGNWEGKRERGSWYAMKRVPDLGSGARGETMERRKNDSGLKLNRRLNG